eukprot:SAG11_NODE_623_length_8115_cov_51.423278_4_plen_110_part_00
MTPNAVRTLESELAASKPLRRLGSDRAARERLGAEHGLTNAQFTLWTQLRTLLVDYGALASAQLGAPLAGDGRPVPLYTFGAIGPPHSTWQHHPTVLSRRHRAPTWTTR